MILADEFEINLVGAQFHRLHRIVKGYVLRYRHFFRHDSDHIPHRKWTHHHHALVKATFGLTGHTIGDRIRPPILFGLSGESGNRIQR